MKEQRLSAMEEFVNLSGTASMDQLCSEFNVSVNTVRRDVAELVRLGKVKKVYGGVISTEVESQRSTTSPFLSYNERSQLRVAAKKSIARVASSFIQDNDVIFIDAGTTTINLVPYFKNTYNVTVVSYCIPIIGELSKYPNVQVLIPPGKLLHNSLSIVGPQAEEYLRKIDFDKTFMACTGVTPEFELTTSNEDESIIKRLAMTNCRENILLADETKFEKKGRVNYQHLNVFQRVISNSRPSQAYMRYLLGHDIEFIEAK